MKSMPVTQWFGPKQKPVHVGYYQVSNGNLHFNSKYFLRGRMIRWWDGKQWLTLEPDHMFSSPSIMGLDVSHKWRGLAEKPE